MEFKLYCSISWMVSFHAMSTMTTVTCATPYCRVTNSVAAYVFPFLHLEVILPIPFEDETPPALVVYVSL